jgi:hypothetical protein
MPGTRIAVSVMDNLITALLAQGEGDREVEARLFPRICRELGQLFDLPCSEIDLILHASHRTPRRDWNMASTCLKRKLSVQP